MGRRLRKKSSHFSTDFAKPKPALQQRFRMRRVVYFGLLTFIAIFCYQQLSKISYDRPTGSVSEVLLLPGQTELVPPLAEKMLAESTEMPQQAKVLPTKPLPAKPAAQTEHVVIKAGDSMALIFDRLHLSAKTLHTLSTLPNAPFNTIHPGQSLSLTIDENQVLQTLRFDQNPTTSIEFTKTDDSYESRVIDHPIEKVHRFANGVIDNSLYLAGQQSGLPDKLIMELATIFGWDIDFALDIRPGDSFHVMYEELFVEGKQIGIGEITAAEFVNNGKKFQAIRFEDKGKADYYTLDGRSIRKAFIRTPVKFTRISSYFRTSRYHPILHRIRSHKGIDYAAPRGTPVKASGDGKIAFRGRKGGYGNAIIIQHGQRYSTLYGHLNGFKKGLKTGQRVKQGEVIGYVGSTGLATGPHLHYEFHVNGIHRDPLKVKLPNASPIRTAIRDEFLTFAKATYNNLLDHNETAIITAKR